MKSLSINPTSSSGGKNQGHGFLPHLLHSHHENRKPSEIYRLVVLGGSKVGKTAIVQRFLYNTFPETHSATVEELHRADYEVKGLGIVGVEILDTSGSFPFPAMQRLAISSGMFYYFSNIFLILFFYFFFLLFLSFFRHLLE